MMHNNIKTKEEIWMHFPETMNKRWIVITFKNGDTTEHNADYIDKVEYIEDE